MRVRRIEKSGRFIAKPRTMGVPPLCWDIYPNNPPCSPKQKTAKEKITNVVNDR